MKALRIATHGLMLLLADMIGIIVGFLVFHLTRPRSQLAVQLPVAVLVVLALFPLWLILSRQARLLRIPRQDLMEWAGILVASLSWGPLILVPTHYVTQGYVTSAGNLVAVALFQLPLNTLTLFLARLSRREERSARRGSPRE